MWSKLQAPVATKWRATGGMFLNHLTDRHDGTCSDAAANQLKPVIHLCSDSAHSNPTLFSTLRPKCTKCLCNFRCKWDTFNPKKHSCNVWKWLTQFMLHARKRCSLHATNQLLSLTHMHLMDDHRKMDGSNGSAADCVFRVLMEISHPGVN